MFDHVQIKVADLPSVRPFYDAIFKALGYAVVFEEAGIVVGYGLSVHNMFEIRQAGEQAPLSCHAHIAFTAADEETVRAFHAAALRYGGQDNGGPGFRPEYEDGYYAAFVIDPSGHNLEAVFSRQQIKPA